jgi:DNA modification methylase
MSKTVLINDQRTPVLRVTSVPISDLKTDPRNARVHNERQITSLTKSIKCFGFVQPILIDEGLQVLAGHGRIEAAKRLGLQHLPAIYVRHLSETQRRAFAIADNRLAEQASWNKKILAEQFRLLSQVELDFDLDVTGFELNEIEMFIEGSPSPGQIKRVRRSAPIPPRRIAAVSKLGDTWQLGRHRLYCGDVLNEMSLPTLMRGKKAAGVFVDPPYQPKTLLQTGIDSGMGLSTADQRTGFLAQVCRLIVDHSRVGSLHYICTDWKALAPLLDATERIYYPLAAISVWKKSETESQSLNRSQDELIVALMNRNSAAATTLRKCGRGGLWCYPGRAKPIGLIADILEDCTAEGEIVLDSFTGDGTTIIAAEQTERLCYGIDIDPVRVDSAIKRWQTYSGGMAVNNATGYTFNDLLGARVV